MPVNKPYNTAIPRNVPSVPAQYTAGRLRRRLKEIELPSASLLDFGCGHGRDVDFYNENGFDTIGYDEHEPFGFLETDQRDFDIVTLTYVLNVIPKWGTRVAALRAAKSRMRDDGIMVITVRSPTEIRRHARNKKWTPHLGGFWSHEPRGTFQAPIERSTLLKYADLAGLCRHILDNEVATIMSRAVHILLAKKGRGLCFVAE